MEIPCGMEASVALYIKPTCHSRRESLFSWHKICVQKKRIFVKKMNTLEKYSYFCKFNN